MNRTLLTKTRHDLAAIAAILDTLVNQGGEDDDIELKGLMLSESAKRLHRIIHSLDKESIDSKKDSL